VKSEGLHSEIYEIDYRGPETHSSTVPPPHHFHIGKPHSTTPQKGSLRGTKALKDYSYAENKASLLYICFLTNENDSLLFFFFFFALYIHSS